MNRKGFIGGSDCVKIMNGDWYDLWQVKTGRGEPDDLSDNLPVQLGVTTEDFNLSWFEKQTGKTVAAHQKEYITTIGTVPVKGTIDGGIRGERNISPRAFPLPEHPPLISPLVSNKRLLTNEHMMSIEQPKVKPAVTDQNEIRLVGNLVLQPHEELFKVRQPMKNIRAPSRQEYVPLRATSASARRRHFAQREAAAPSKSNLFEQGRRSKQTGPGQFNLNALGSRKNAAASFKETPAVLVDLRASETLERDRRGFQFSSRADGTIPHESSALGNGKRSLCPELTQLVGAEQNLCFHDQLLRHNDLQA